MILYFCFVLIDLNNNYKSIYSRNVCMTVFIKIVCSMVFMKIVCIMAFHTNCLYVMLFLCTLLLFKNYFQYQKSYSMFEEHVKMCEFCGYAFLTSL